MSHPARLVVDASVAVAWVTDEPISPWSRGLLRQGYGIIAPPIFWTECANAFWRIARMRSGDGFDAAAAFGRILALPLEIAAPEPSLATAALSWATRLDHPVYDCLYLALALALDRDAALATADLRFARVVQRAGVLPAARLLTPPAPASPG